MASAASATEDLTICPICLETFNNPRCLPCVHTFCLQCIRTHCRDSQDGDKLACPLCRKEFQIPAGGVERLAHNFFMQTLIDARKRGKAGSGVLCEGCAEEGQGGLAGNIPPATTYCMDCSQKLCQACSAPHRRLKTGAHVVKLLSEITSDDIVQARASQCQKHAGKQVELYCFDCKTNICLMCFAVEHKQHNCQEIDKAAAEFIGQIEETVKSLQDRINKLDADREGVETKRREFVQMTAEVTQQIEQKGEELHRLVSGEVTRLKREVETIEGEKLKKLDHETKSFESNMKSLRGFISSWKKTKNKKPTDITQSFTDIQNTARQLQSGQRLDSKPTRGILAGLFKKKDVAKIDFRSTNVDELLTATDAKNNIVNKTSLIGEILVIRTFSY